MSDNLQQNSNILQKYNRLPFIAIIGPTAIGKTNLSLKIAHDFTCEIISVDSMQIYRYMDIGTAKPSQVERETVPHHLFDIVDPDEDYQAARFVYDAEMACEEIIKRGHIPLLVGGTGLYIRCFQEGLFNKETGNTEKYRLALQQEVIEKGPQHLYRQLEINDPDSAMRIHPNDTNRIIRALEIYQSTGTTWSEYIKKQQNNLKDQIAPRNFLKIGLTCDRKILYDRINQRVEMMAEQGLIKEVESLLAKGYSPELKSMQSIGYRHIINFLENRWSWSETMRLLARDTRHYAKRQFTWFNKDPSIQWFSPENEKEIITLIDNFLANLKEGQVP
ncbi:MAG: tRNA (adenosine(37)-N6)-dimethylallyltransferase MiaA [Proteobacteria bacterium]|nr:tRNA (adenosine(37)-N6)-dimethylallyltransferase MiaA [Pseudomonadota bacterium]MBU1716487.1 tRNA (adenosine(37)-N6)-dimethylallyltransferase MiaA [Pseudomonadota bacterium]